MVIISVNMLYAFIMGNNQIYWQSNPIKLSMYPEVRKMLLNQLRRGNDNCTQFPHTKIFPISII